MRHALLSVAPDYISHNSMEDVPPSSAVVQYSMSNPAEESLRQRMLEKRRKEKRSRDVATELDWLENNSLFRGARPHLGESYEDYVDRIAKKRRIVAEQRKQKVTVMGDSDRKRRRVGRASNEVSHPVFQEVQVGIAGELISDS